MTEIDLEIKGDPYWLGQTTLEREVELNNIRVIGAPVTVPVSGQSPAPRRVNREELDRVGRDSLFMLLFRAGVAPNEQTGYMSLNNNVEWFHALYIGIEVTHMFRDGKFTQKIHAIREPINNLVAGGAPPVTLQQQAPVEQPPAGGVAPRAPVEEPPRGAVAARPAAIGVPIEGDR